MACLISAAGGDATTCLASSWVGTCSPTPSPPSSPATPDVLCGGHRAETCALCPFSDGTINGENYGASWCSGDCSWDAATNICMTPSVPSPAPSDKSGLSTAALVGIGLGAVVGVLAIGGGGIFLMKKKTTVGTSPKL